ncbi:MAG: hypothetical protein SRB1_02107 [Desulfobacteraceae bacterium Eth-SRB1]|nr:MAG: hypothetical protein SRB1_02107 [Desulfobacteraceae bacterium Eth-SRB1]
MKKTFIVILGTALLMVMGFVGSAMAIGNIKIGNIAVHPSITEKGMWDSNIDLNADNGTAGEERKGDYINTLTPAVKFQLKKSLLDVSFGANVDIVRYDEYDKNDAENYMANFSGQYGSIGRTGLYFKFNEQFMDTQDPYSKSGVGYVGDTNYRLGLATKKKSNIAGIEVGYGMADRIAFHLSYTNNYLKYDSYTRDRDSNEKDHIAGATLYYKILPKTYALLGYQLKSTDYFDYDTKGLSDCGKDSKNHNLDFGLFWDQTEKLNGSVKVGYYWKKWDNAVNNGGVPLEDLNTWTITTHLGWKPLTRTTIMIDLTKGEVDSVDATYYSYDQFVAGLRLNQQVVNKLSITVGGNYEIDDYNNSAAGTPEKKFNLYQANAGINYQIMKWLRAGISYTYKKKDANQINAQTKDEEYKDHQTMFKITGSF